LFRILVLDPHSVAQVCDLGSHSINTHITDVGYRFLFVFSSSTRDR
jgi:hypothetical protein